MLSKEQQTAAEYIGLLSVYPSLIPIGSTDSDGTDLKAALEDNLHEFAQALGVASAVSWHDPDASETKQTAINPQALKTLKSGADLIAIAIEMLGGEADE